jgi:glycosyltransferase involved in cell wall biosynthesis
MQLNASGVEPPVPEPIRVGFVLHVMQVAGAEMLVAEIIRRLGPVISPVVFCLDGVGALGEIMQAEGVEVVALGRRPGLDLRIIGRLAHAIRSRRLQVLHAHQYTPFFYGALAARFARAGTRVVFTEHGRHYPDVVSAKRRVMNQVILRRLADRTTAVCAFSAGALREKEGFRGTRIDVIENGIDVERFGLPADRALAKRAIGLDPRRRYISTIARFHPVKDHETLLRAFADVCGAVDDVDLLLAGDGPLRPRCEELVRARGMAARVKFLGVRRDVPAILRASDVFALTSLSEAASITLLEAMATGVPVVVTDVGGNPEIVRRDVDGLLTPRGDAGALRSSLLTVLSDSKRAAGLGRSAAGRARDVYRIERTISRYRQVYLDMASQGT